MSDRYYQHYLREHEGEQLEAESVRQYNKGDHANGELICHAHYCIEELAEANDALQQRLATLTEKALAVVKDFCGPFNLCEECRACYDEIAKRLTALAGGGQVDPTERIQ